MDMADFFVRESMLVQFIIDPEDANSGQLDATDDVVVQLQLFDGHIVATVYPFCSRESATLLGNALRIGEDIIDERAVVRSGVGVATIEVNDLVQFATTFREVLGAEVQRLVHHDDQGIFQVLNRRCREYCIGGITLATEQTQQPKMEEVGVRRSVGLHFVNFLIIHHPAARVKMVAQQIKREIGDMLITDLKIRNAISPEAALGADLYLSSVTTVTDVEVSRDLQIAKVYISVFGDKRGKEIAFAGLKAQEKYVRMQIGRRMRLRLTPEVRFIEDDSLERGSKVIRILDRLKAEREREEQGELAQYNSDENEDDEDDDDDDEELILVK